MPVSTPAAMQLFLQGSQVFADIEANGIAIDTALLNTTIEKVDRRIGKIKAKLQQDEVYSLWEKEYGSKTKLGSGEQMANVLYKKMGIPCTKYTPKPSPVDLGYGRHSWGYLRPSTDEDALEEIDHPFVRRLFKMKGLEKTCNTFLKGIRKEMVDGFIHPFFHLHLVQSFRSSSSSINFQNIVKRDEELAALVRSVIIPRRGWRMWEGDFKSAEVVLAATITRCPALRKYVTDKKNDMHRDSGADLFLLRPDQIDGGVRQLVKGAFVFASFYGSYYKQTGEALWKALRRDKNQKLLVKGTQTHILEHLASKGITDGGKFDPEADAYPGTFEHHVKNVERIFWHERFKGYTEWKKRFYEQYRAEVGFWIPSGFWVPAPRDRKQVLNYPIQGASFHCLLWVLIQLQKWIRKNKMQTQIIGQIHDSINGDSPPDEVDAVLHKIKELVEVDLPKHWDWLTIPMAVEASVGDVDASWHDLKPYEFAAG